MMAREGIFLRSWHGTTAANDEIRLQLFVLYFWYRPQGYNYSFVVWTALAEVCIP